MKYLLEAIDKRVSRRSYLNHLLEKEKVEKLNHSIDNYCKEKNFKISFITEDETLFKSFFSSYGLIKDVRNYFALSCKKNDLHAKVELGYYGEILVLESTNMGFSTCWIGGSYDKQKCHNQLNLNEDEELVAIIAVGYAAEKIRLKEKFIHKIAKRKTKEIKEMLISNEVIPELVFDGMKAVQKAPSSRNSQPVLFEYKDGIITAYVKGNQNEYALDLGIALLHFQLGSVSTADWELTNGMYRLIIK